MSLAKKDSFDSLPDNLYLEIFLYLSVKELLQVQRVSKRWHRLVCDYWLWRKVKITPHPITKVVFAKLARRYFTEATTSIDVCGAWRGRDMNSTVSISDNVLSLITKHSPKLKEFKIEEDNLREVNLSLLPSSLQAISFTNCEIPIKCLESVKNQFKGLKSLLFRRCPIVQERHLAAFGKIEALERLECYGCYRIDHAGICAISENFPNLRTLVLIGCPHLGDRSCRTIAEELPQLRVIEIEEWVDITMDGVTTLRKKLRNLKFLSVKCRSINEGKIVIEGSRVHV